MVAKEKKVANGLAMLGEEGGGLYLYVRGQERTEAS